MVENYNYSFFGNAYSNRRGYGVPPSVGVFNPIDFPRATNLYPYNYENAFHPQGYTQRPFGRSTYISSTSGFHSKKSMSPGFGFPKARTDSFTCRICNVICNSEIIWKTHLESKKHKTKEQEESGKAHNNIEVKPIETTDPKTEKAVTENRSVDTIGQIAQQAETTEDKILDKEIIFNVSEVGPVEVKCLSCNIRLASLEMLAIHIESNDHTTNRRELLVKEAKIQKTGSWVMRRKKTFKSRGGKLSRKKAAAMQASAQTAEFLNAQYGGSIAPGYCYFPA